ncbi:MAG: hypothetical protein ACREE4_22750, partial [Stellaceae bacterium]
FAPSVGLRPPSVADPARLSHPDRRAPLTLIAAQQHIAATANIRYFRGRRNSPVRSVLCNAAEFDIPDDPCILYLYNPFEAAVVKHVARRVVASYRVNPRHILIVYYNQTVFDAFEAEGWFRHTRTIREDFLSGLLHPTRYAIRILEAR